MTGQLLRLRPVSFFAAAAAAAAAESEPRKGSGSGGGRTPRAGLGPWPLSHIMPSCQATEDCLCTCFCVDLLQSWVTTQEQADQTYVLESSFDLPNH